MKMLFAVMLGTFASIFSVAGAERPDRDSFAIVEAGRDGVQFHGNTRDLKTVERLKREVASPFAWFRLDGHEYVLSGKERVAPLLAYWKGLDAEQEKMERFAQRNEKLAEEMERVHAEHVSLIRGRTEPDERALHQVDRKMDAISERMERVGEEMEWVGERIDALSEDASKKTFAALADAVRNQTAVTLKE